MTREEQKASYAKKYYPDDFNCYYAFMEGAAWAEKHPNLASLWHDTSEEPQGEYYVISHKKDGAIDFINYTSVKEYYYSWKYYIKEENIVSWAYINDLLPKGGKL